MINITTILVINIIHSLVVNVNNNFKILKGENTMRANEDIRAYARSSGVYLWEVADELKILDAALSRKLRHELKQDEKDRIFKIIDEIAERKAAARSQAV